jgi:hypothetical protein
VLSRKTVEDEMQSTEAATREIGVESGIQKDRQTVEVKSELDSTSFHL